MAKLTPPHRSTGLFSDPAPDAKLAAWRANIDGGSRGNPGPAAYGVVIRDPRGDIVARLKKYIGRTTNNVAEYKALLLGIATAREVGGTELDLVGDSELIVRQIEGRYKVKHADMKELHAQARKMLDGFDSWSIRHVKRAQNADADKLVNQALDDA